MTVFSLSLPSFASLLLQQLSAKTHSLLICCLPFHVHCSPGNKPLSLLPGFLCPIIFAVTARNAALSVPVRLSRLADPLSCLSSVPVFSHLTWTQPASTDHLLSSCPLALFPSLSLLSLPTHPTFLFSFICGYSCFSSLNSHHSQPQSIHSLSY